MRTLTRLTLLLILPWFSAAGCSIQLPGFRFAPNEDQKTSATAAADIATIASITGLPPGSAAAKQAAAGGRAAAAYLGAPARPLAVDDLFPPAVAAAWSTKERQADAHALQARIRAKGAELQTRGLAYLVTTIGDRRDVPAKEIAPLAQSLSLQAHMTEELANSVRVPADVELSEAERQRLEMLSGALATITAKAQEVAALRPTSKEVAERAVETVDETLDSIGKIVDHYPWLSGILAGVPVVGTVLYARKNGKAAKLAQAEVEKVKANGGGAAGAPATAADVLKLAIDALARSSPPAATPAVASGDPPPTPASVPADTDDGVAPGPNAATG